MGFNTELLQIPSKSNDMTAIAKAVVTVKDGENIREFTGIGDASPSSVNRMIAPHIIRMAETRALGRAMRFLTGFGTVFEELGEVDFEDKKPANNRKPKAQEEPKKEVTANNASKAQLNKIEKDAKALGFSAKQVFEYLGIDPGAVSKAEASKAIKFLKSDEVNNLQGTPSDSSEGEVGITISDDELPF